MYLTFEEVYPKPQMAHKTKNKELKQYTNK